MNFTQIEVYCDGVCIADFYKCSFAFVVSLFSSYKHIEFRCFYYSDDCSFVVSDSVLFEKEESDSKNGGGE